MGRKEIKDPNGKLLGYYGTDSTGKEYINDGATGRRLGSYDEKSDKTHDANGRLVSRGDSTSSLLRKPKQ